VPLRSGERAARLEVSNDPARVGISSGLVTNRARRAHTPVVSIDDSRVRARHTLGELLPFGFGPAHLRSS
jgi:hypothetical protein